MAVWHAVLRIAVWQHDCSACSMQHCYAAGSLACKMAGKIRLTPLTADVLLTLQALPTCSCYANGSLACNMAAVHIALHMQFGSYANWRSF
jgi:hypothetical protein